MSASSTFVRLIAERGYKARYRPPYDPRRVLTNMYLEVPPHYYWHVKSNALLLNRALIEHRQHEIIDPSAEQKLADLDRDIRATREQSRRNDAERAGRLQLTLLRNRLLGLGLFPDDPDQAQGNWKYVEQTGEMIVWWLIGGWAFGEWNGDVVVEREARGGIEWTRLDDDGRPIEPWQRSAPPPWRLN